MAWFSPFPPVRTGIAACSAELVGALAARGHRIDPYPESRAHDFPWRHRQEPYDLVVYQFGNSSHHDYEWPYALRYPGLTVLHDTRLHHARAALLLREKRVADYRDEFRANHPDVPADAAELGVAGLDSRLYYEWNMARALVTSARLVAVHGEGAQRELVASLSTPNDQDANSQSAWLEKIVSIRLGHGQFVGPEEEERARRQIRARYGIPEDAVVFGVFGGLTPEKRIAQILAAFRAILPHAPNAWLMLGGDHAERADRITVTGYIADEELTDHIAAVDVSLNLRWPTARETSGPWLRALAAGKPTVMIDLAHLTDVASLDPRTWLVREAGVGERVSGAEYRVPDPVCVAIDILDEDHSLRLAMRRLATDAELRLQLGTNAQRWWKQQHSLEVMVDDYESAFARCASFGGIAALGGNGSAGHLRPSGDERLCELLQPFGLESPL